MTNSDFTHTPTPGATSNRGVSEPPITPPSHLRGADACRYVLEEAQRRRILRQAQAEQAEKASREAELTRKRSVNSELDPLRQALAPKLPTPESTQKPRSNRREELDPGFINESDF